MNLFLPICAVALVSGLAALRADAQTAVEAAERWGLLGTWMPDCQRPPDVANRNTRNAYVVKGGQLFLDRNLGPQHLPDSAPITGANMRPDGTIDLTEYFGNVQPPQTRRTTITKDGNGRIRVWTNVDLNTGEHSVRDGVLIHNGMPTPWQGRCN